MKRTLSCLFTYLCLALAIAKEDASIFPGRSGDIIVRPDDIQDGSFVIISGDVFSSEETASVSSIEETSVADLISHVTGGPVVSFEASRQILSTLKAPFYQKAKANLLFVVNEAEEKPNLSIASNRFGKKLSLKRVAYPQDHIASLTTLTSGAPPSTHGIVGSSWRIQDGKIIAYKSEALPVTASVQDVFSQVFEGRSLTVTASADFQMTAALGVHRFLFSENPHGNNHAFSYSSMKRSFVNIYGSEDNISLNVTKDFMLNNLFARQFPLEGVTMIDGRIDVSLPAQNIKTSFLLSKKTDFFLFAEMEFVYNLLNQLQQSPMNELVKDAIPDLYSFSFTGLKEIASLYGKNSAQYSAGIYLIDAFIQEVTSQFSALYDGKLATEVVFMNTPASVALLEDREAMRRIYSIVKSDVVSRESFDAHYPSIYLESGAHQTQFCDQIRSRVPLEVICPRPVVTLANADQFGNLRQNGTVPSTNSTAATFQIILWSSILLVLILYATIYSMYSMDVGKDSMLYRMTGARHAHRN